MSVKRSDVVRYKAYGKVNLALGIRGLFDDGYHRVSTIMASVNLFDVVTVSRVPRGLEVVCLDMPGLREQDNLAYKAGQLILSECRPEFGVRITIEKSIPVSSGMGGGSSDAAASLLGINDLLDRSQRIGLERMLSMARGLGADVPFLLGTNRTPACWGAGLCEGRGDHVTPLLGNRFHLVIVPFKEGVSTAWAYSQWDDCPEASRLKKHLDARTAIVKKALESGDPILLSTGVYNDLEAPVCRVRGDIAAVKERLLTAGALCAQMTGSGPTVFGICLSEDHALDVRERFLASSPLGVGKEVFVTEVRAVERGGTG